MGSILNSVTVSQLGIISSASPWNFLREVGIRSCRDFDLRANLRGVCGPSAADDSGNFGYLRNPRKKRIASSCFEVNKEGYCVPEKLEPLWDDGYGSQTAKDYMEIAKDIVKPDDGPPRWFCPIECGCPLKDSPVLLYLPGSDGLGLGLILHHRSLGRVFEVRCMHIPVNDRTPYKGLVNFVENAVRLENASSCKKPIYLVGESLGACIALSVAARNPTIDLVLILINPATSYSRSKLQYLLPLLEASPDQLQSIMPYFCGLTSGDPFKMAMVNTTGMSPTQKAEQAISELTACLPPLSELADIIPMEFYTWKLKLLKSAAAYANSRLHAVKAQVLMLASGKDSLFPSQDEAMRLSKSLQRCRIRHFKDSGHALLMEDGYSLLTIIKGTGSYRRKTKLDMVLDYLPPSLSEFNLTFDKLLGFFRTTTSPVTFSTLEDGNIVRGLRGVPDQGPVLLVGYHMLLGVEINYLVEAFLREKKTVVHGLAHPALFTDNFRSIEFSYFDLFGVYGAIPVSGRNLFKLFSNKAHVLLYPGGIREALHRKGEHYKLFWPRQPEFVRMAIRFGVTIVPFGVVGSDDILELFLDYNDQMKIPSLRKKIIQQNQDAIKIRNRTELEGEEISNQDFYVPAFHLKKPGRFYFLFGKPIETKNMMESWKDEHFARKLYLQIKSTVEQNMAYLLEKRKQDPYRDIFARIAYCAISRSTTDIPSFKIHEDQFQDERMML